MALRRLRDVQASGDVGVGEGVVMVRLLGGFASLFLAGGLCLLAGCQSANTPAAAASPSNASSAAAKPVVDDSRAVDAFVASGPITVENQIDLTSQREGMVASILVDAGTTVRKGQLLARLDDRQIK